MRGSLPVPPFHLLLLSFLLSGVLVAQEERKPKKQKRVPSPNWAGIVVMDNCDPAFRGKDDYEDNLTLVNPAGKKRTRLSGFNNCETIGSGHKIATDLARGSMWTVENVAWRLRRFDLMGKETLVVPDVRANALAVDPKTGNVWVLSSTGTIYGGKTLVFDPKGREIATHAVPGFDIAYDRKAKAFWVVGKDVAKISAATGKTLFSKPVCVWCASSVGVDPRSGCAWVAVRRHSQVDGSKNRLLKFDPNGKELLAIELKDKVPFCVSVNHKDGSVWVAHMRRSIQRFSPKGRSMKELPVKALAIQVDPTGGVWVVTRSGLQKRGADGKLLREMPHASETSQAWIGVMK